ncbi:hypothetical protein [Burkholderia ubonensis]|nr:hypothetical protein [Burkholderia ubonensis]
MSAYVKPSEIAFAIGPLLNDRVENGAEGLHLNPHSTVPSDAAVSMYQSLRKYINGADLMDKNMSFKDRYENRRDYLTHEYESRIPDASFSQWKDSKDLKMLNDQLRTTPGIPNHGQAPTATRFQRKWTHAEPTEAMAARHGEDR